MVLMADPVSLSVVRERFRRWLGALRWPPREVDDVVMAVNEAVTSAVEHTHPSAIGAEVRVAARQYAEPDGGQAGPRRGGGRGALDARARGFEGPGLLMIHACMDAIEGQRRRAVAAFDGGAVTSDAGALLLGATDKAIGLIERFAGCFSDGRSRDRIEHEITTLVGQRVFGLSARPTRMIDTLSSVSG